jgi:hypothetical protein
MCSSLPDRLRFTSSWSIHYVQDDPLPQIRRAFSDSTFLIGSLDLAGISNLASLIRCLIESVGLPGYTGCNLDALIDSLGDLPDGHEGYILVAYDASDFWSRRPKLGLDFVGCWTSGAAFWIRSNIPCHLVFVA